MVWASIYVTRVYNISWFLPVALPFSHPSEKCARSAGVNQG